MVSRSKSTPVVTDSELVEIVEMFESTEPSVSGFVFVEDNIVDTHDDWFENWLKVVQTPDGRFLALSYEVGKTPYQQGDERKPTVDDVVEVFPHPVMTVEYTTERPKTHEGVYGHLDKIE